MKPLPFRLLMGGIIVLVGAPMLGLLGTVFGMIFAFRDLGDNGIAAPKDLASHVGIVMMAPLTGLVVAGIIGLPLIIVALAIHFGGRPAKS